MSAMPHEYSIRNGCFIGYALVMVPVEHTKPGMKPAPVEGWRFFAIDLRDVTHLGAGVDHAEERTILFHGQTEIATVNIAAHDLLPHWLSLRHAFERIPTTEEARRDMVQEWARTEAIPGPIKLNLTP